MIEAAVVQIDGADNSLPVVTNKDLGMYEAGGVFVDLHPGFQQGSVMGQRKGKGDVLIWNTRQDDPHINTALGGILERIFQLTVQNQIWRHDMDILLGPVQHIHVDLLAHLVLVQGAVSVRHDKTVCSLLLCRYIQKCVKIRCLFIQVPHVQEHPGEAAGCFALYHHGGVLPVTVLFIGVDVFIRQIDAAVEGGLPVDHQDLPVIAVVIMGGDKGLDGGKHFALNAKRSKPPGVVMGQGRQLTGAVVEHTDLHALFGLPRQDLQDLAPHFPLIHDEVLQEDEPLCLLQLDQHLPELVLA